MWRRATELRVQMFPDVPPTSSLQSAPCRPATSRVSSRRHRSECKYFISTAFYRQHHLFCSFAVVVRGSLYFNVVIETKTNKPFYVFA